MFRRGCLCLQLLTWPRRLRRPRCSSAFERDKTVASFSKQLPRPRQCGRPDRLKITQPAAAAAGWVIFRRSGRPHWRGRGSCFENEATVLSRSKADEQRGRRRRRGQVNSCRHKQPRRNMRRLPVPTDWQDKAQLLRTSPQRLPS